VKEILLTCCDNDLKTKTLGWVISRLEADLKVPKGGLETRKQLLTAMITEEINSRHDPDNHMSLTVQASVESGDTRRWTCTVNVDEPLTNMAHDWARAHHIPDNAVGFDVLEGTDWYIADIRRSPKSLAWKGTAILRAFPADGTGDGFAEAPKRSREHKETLEAAPPAKREKVSHEQLESSAKRGHTEHAPDKGSFAVKGISDSEPIKFDQTNPKRAGTDACDRYEKYKSAKTIREAMALGAAKGDISNDVSRGFCKRG
jgi:hypothetical protein